MSKRNIEQVNRQVEEQNSSLILTKEIKKKIKKTKKDKFTHSELKKYIDMKGN